MDISRFNISQLRIEEWFRFHTEFWGLATQCGVEVLDIIRLFSPYETLYKEADGLLEILRKSFITVDTASADRLRGRLFRGLRDAAKSFQYVLDEAKQAAGIKVNAVIRKYSNSISKGARGEKTAAIDNLLQDLTQVEGGIDLSAEIQLLGLGTWVTDLAAANTAYKETLSERVEESTSRPDTGRLRQVRSDMDRYYRNMINTIDARLLAIDISPANEEEETPSGPVEDRDAQPSTPDEKIIHFAKALNTYIAYYKSLLKGRQTRGGKKDPEEDDSPKEDI
ncbi:MAG: DUF6261 family protein [Tannerellaceae bacterium]|jgi:hypothetical protein|nr:DUF6261 family protein [Tannerellaceae bacterium]